MKILITGGTGFIGSNLAFRCLEKGDEVTILAQQNTDAEKENCRQLEEKGINIVLGTVTAKDSINKAIQGSEIVFHLAATQHEMNVPDQRFWDVNVEGTRNMLDASVEAGVRRFVHGSTIGVYGIMDGEISETSPCDPDNIYGVTKLEGEKLVLEHKDKLPVVAIRIPETYGPGDRRLLKLFKAINKNMFFMIGKGENLHHLIYVDDLIEGFFLAANDEKAVGELFLLAGEKPITTNEMVGTISEVLGAKIPKIRAPLWLLWSIATVLEMALRPIGIQPPIHRRRMDFFKKSFSLNPQKAKDILSFSPDVDFREGVTQTAEWYRQMGLL